MKKNIKKMHKIQLIDYYWDLYSQNQQYLVFIDYEWTTPKERQKYLNKKNKNDRILNEIEILLKVFYDYDIWDEIIKEFFSD